MEIDKKIDENTEHVLTQEQFEQMMLEKFERVRTLFLARNNVFRLDTEE